MSDFDWDDDDTDTSNDSTGMKELRKALRAEQKRNKEMSSKLDEMLNSSRDRTVKDIITSKGLPDKLSKLIPSDVTSPEDVENWIAEYADLFGAAPSEENQEPAVDAADMQALRRISSTQQSGQVFDGDVDQLDARIRAAQSPEELNKVLFGSAHGPQVV
jgi:hypothetical protein|tara:strand:- start:328 stop:807 length:480 start_codon:yes stop_codon:yes gene_type:complete